jgi:hypothetical protein
MSTPPSAAGAGDHAAVAPVCTQVRVPVLPPGESASPIARRPDAHWKEQVPWFVAPLHESQAGDLRPHRPCT